MTKPAPQVSITSEEYNAMPWWAQLGVSFKDLTVSRSLLSHVNMWYWNRRGRLNNLAALAKTMMTYGPRIVVERAIAEDIAYLDTQFKAWKRAHGHD